MVGKTSPVEELDICGGGKSASMMKPAEAKRLFSYKVGGINPTSAAPASYNQYGPHDSSR